MRVDTHLYLCIFIRVATLKTSHELPQEGSRKRPIDLIETDVESTSPESYDVVKKV